MKIKITEIKDLAEAPEPDPEGKNPVGKRPKGAAGTPPGAGAPAKKKAAAEKSPQMSVPAAIKIRYLDKDKKPVPKVVKGGFVQAYTKNKEGKEISAIQKFRGNLSAARSAAADELRLKMQGKWKPGGVKKKAADKKGQAPPKQKPQKKPDLKSALAGLSNYEKKKYSKQIDALVKLPQINRGSGPGTMGDVDPETGKKALAPTRFKDLDTPEKIIFIKFVEEIFDPCGKGDMSFLKGLMSGGCDFSFAMAEQSIGDIGKGEMRASRLRKNLFARMKEQHKKYASEPNP